MLLAGLLTAMPALADVTAVYQLDRKNQMTVSVRDQNHVRMDVAKDMFLLLKGEKTYSVRKEGNGWVAMDMDQIRKMTEGFGGMPMNDADDEGPQGSFRDTGRTETVAGYKGKVYEITDGDGERTEVVLTDHKDLTTITQAMTRFGVQSASNMGFAGAGKVPDLSGMAGGYTGLLRQDKHMTLLSVDKSGKGSGYFDLPPGTVMEKMPGMGGAGGSGGMGMPPGMNMQDMQKQMEEAMKQMKQMQQR
jgi:hypothetical protein